jgi:hypothetical protein
LWSPPTLIRYLQDRLTARVGDQLLPKLRYNVTVTESFIGDLDFPSHIYAAASLPNVNLAASGRNQRGCQPFGQQPQYNETWLSPTN